MSVSQIGECCLRTEKERTTEQVLVVVRAMSRAFIYSFACRYKSGVKLKVHKHTVIFTFVVMFSWSNLFVIIFAWFVFS